MQEGMRFADPSAQRVLIAHQSIDYLREASYPGELEIGVGVLRIGTSSYTFGMGMFQHGECASVSDAVMVFADPSGPIRIPDQARKRLEAWLLHADDAT
jgi:acyl-CoA thioester hydrolase